MSFDRLQYIDRLKEAGVDESVARAHAEALRHAMAETVATKADLREAADASDARFDEVERKFDVMDRKIDALGFRLDNKIDALGQRLDAKIDVVARDLVIKGAGGLIIVASLIVGLKIFG